MVGKYWVCFECLGTQRDKNGRPYPLRTLKQREKREHGLGNIIRTATVCTRCYDQGATRIPVGFNGLFDPAHPPAQEDRE
jgi:hypothetical protein